MINNVNPLRVFDTGNISSPISKKNSSNNNKRVSELKEAKKQEKKRKKIKVRKIKKTNKQIKREQQTNRYLLLNNIKYNKIISPNNEKKWKKNYKKLTKKYSWLSIVPISDDDNDDNNGNGSNDEPFDDDEGFDSDFFYLGVNGNTKSKKGLLMMIAIIRETNNQMYNITNKKS